MPQRKWLKRLCWFVCYWLIGVAALVTWFMMMGS